MIRILKMPFQHPLSRNNPVPILFRLLTWQIRSRFATEKIRFDWIDNTVLMVSRGMTGATGNVYYGLHEYSDMAFILHFLKERDVFLDVGANIGSYTILASGVRGAHSVSFEPDPVTRSHLIDNVTANKIENKVEIEACAVGEMAGQINFTKGKDTLNRVATEQDTETHSVTMKRIDDVEAARGAALMKIDVEGHELGVLLGAQQLLQSDTLKAIEAETVDPEIHALLTSHGFSKYWYDPRDRSLSANAIADLPSANSLYLRDLEFVKKRLRMATRLSWNGISI